jgi:hypothetical protein
VRHLQAGICLDNTVATQEIVSQAQWARNLSFHVQYREAMQGATSLKK